MNQTSTSNNNFSFGTYTAGTATLCCTSEGHKLLAEVFQRACNTWDQAPAEVKELADLITNGKVMQDYAAQEGTTLAS